MNLSPYLSLCVSLALASWFRPAGWLDRLVQYHKQKFLEEVRESTPVQIKATIESKPGYVDSGSWDYDSVIRLLTLLRDSEQAKPTRVALRRMLQPSRRFLSKTLSFKIFPSLSKPSANDFYYDVDSEEVDHAELLELPKGGLVEEDSVIVITNPVESRLPSSQISVKLLKEILENRAVAARILPSTRRRTTVSTKKGKKKKGGTTPSLASNDTTGNSTDDKAPAASTIVDGASAAGGDTTVGGAGGDTTAAPAE